METTIYTLRQSGHFYSVNCDSKRLLHCKGSLPTPPHRHLPPDLIIISPPGPQVSIYNFYLSGDRQRERGASQTKGYLAGGKIGISAIQASTPPLHSSPSRVEKNYLRRVFLSTINIKGYAIEKCMFGSKKKYKDDPYGRRKIENQTDILLPPIKKRDD